ncbi:MAG TPA: nuclear transport factor 2 family protein [Paracoccaceae bacterium]|nr:nuclear transport factor 2 family protein [Paracoccaceae bacterium]
MTSQTSKTADEAKIRALLEAGARAAAAGDLAAIMANYAPDIRAFDAIIALEFKGREAYGVHWQACLAQVQGPMHFYIDDLEVSAEGSIGFASFLAHCGCTKPDGTEDAGWLRVTVCLRKDGGDWKIAHEHYSVPFDPVSGKALTNLAPGETAQATAA